MARLATVGTKTSVRTATTLVHGECTLIIPSTIQIHRLGTAGRVLVAREGRQREGTRRGGTRRWLKGGKGTGVGSGSLVLLD